MQFGRVRGLGFGFAVALVLAMTPVAAGASDESSDESSAEQYCQDQGGTPLEVQPYLFPESDNQVQLHGSMKVCQFVSVEDDDPAQLIVDLGTLYSEKPTLAGLAYLAQVPSSNSGPAGSNPAASYCPNDLGGTEQFGTSATGAWVGDFDPGMEAGYSQPLGNTVDLCVFADRSAISDFGIFYASEGIYRGVNLAEVMRYQPDSDTPDAFDTGS